MKKKHIALFAACALTLFLCGCSEFRNTFALFGGNVEKTEETAHTFTAKDDVWQFSTEYGGNTTFFSSDETVATVDGNGNVKPRSSGSAVITAASSDGKFMSSVKVEVLLSETLRGVWVSTAWNIDFPSESGLTEEKLKAEIDEIVENTASWGLNAIFLQVRPMNDSIYPSEIFPTSTFVGEGLPFDILEYFISAAHSKGIELHAWINPYRCKTANEYTFESDGVFYYDPGLPEVRKIVVDGVREILNNYDVDGIHFDDYFYPSGDFDDSATFEKYGNGAKIGDWRRDNVTELIKEVSSVVKKKSGCVFGVSPGGIWATKQNEPDGVEGLGNTSQTYYDVYADTKKWVEEGLLDYICPQIYWQLESKIAPFGKIAEWWSDLCEKNGVSLYVGIAAYRGESSEAYKDPDEIKNELAFLSGLSGCDGEVYFSYSSLKNDLASVQATLKEVYGR